MPQIKYLSLDGLREFWTSIKSKFYNKTEIDTKLGEKANTNQIPTKNSQLVNDSNYITKQDIEQTFMVASDTNGDIVLTSNNFSFIVNDDNNGNVYFT